MPDGRCATCRWWKVQETNFRALKDLWGDCEKLTSSDMTLCYCNGNDNGMGGIETKRDFGCVLWEKKQ